MIWRWWWWSSEICCGWESLYTLSPFFIQFRRLITKPHGMKHVCMDRWNTHTHTHILDKQKIIHHDHHWTTKVLLLSTDSVNFNELMFVVLCRFRYVNDLCIIYKFHPPGTESSVCLLDDKTMRNILHHAIYNLISKDYAYIYILHRCFVFI